MELVPWRGDRVPVLSSNGNGVSRSSYNLGDYLSWLENSWRYGGNLYPTGVQGVTVTQNGKQAEPVANNFTGYVQSLFYSSTPVAAVEWKRVEIFAQAPLLFQTRRDGRPGDLYDDESLDLARTPWPGGTTSDLLGRAVLYADMGGAAYIAVIDDEIVVLRPDYVEIALEPRMVGGSQVGWKQVGITYTELGPNAGRPAVFLRGEYAMFAPHPDPLASYRGMSWLTPVIREVMADKAAVEHRLSFMTQAATPNLAISVPQAMTVDQFEEWVAKMDAAHKGPQNAGKTLYTAGGADVTVIGSSMKEMDLAALLGKSETRVTNAAGLHAALLGFSEGMQGSSLNAGNYQAAKRQVVDTTFRHLWANFCGSLQALFQPPKAGDRLWYDIRDIPFLHDDARDLAAVQQTQGAIVTAYVREGFTPDSAIAAVKNDDIGLLKHTGLTSVQLTPPGEGEVPPEEAPVEETVVDGEAGVVPEEPVEDTYSEEARSVAWVWEHVDADGVLDDEGFAVLSRMLEVPDDEDIIRSSVQRFALLDWVTRNILDANKHLHGPDGRYIRKLLGVDSPTDPNAHATQRVPTHSGGSVSVRLRPRKVRVDDRVYNPDNHRQMGTVVAIFAEPKIRVRYPDGREEVQTQFGQQRLSVGHYVTDPDNPKVKGRVEEAWTDRTMRVQWDDGRTEVRPVASVTDPVPEPERRYAGTPGPIPPRMDDELPVRELSSAEKLADLIAAGQLTPPQRKHVLRLAAGRKVETDESGRRDTRDVAKVSAELRGMTPERAREYIRDLGLTDEEIDQALNGAPAPAAPVKKVVAKAAKKAAPKSTAPTPKPEPLSTDPAVRAAQVEQRVRDAYARLATEPGAWVDLSRLRTALGDDLSADEATQALRRLYDSPGVNLEPEANQSSLTVDRRQASVRIGGEDRHLISIDPPRTPRAADPSDHSAPTAAPEPLSSDPRVRAVQIENRIRQAYRDIRADGSGDWVMLSDLRDRLGDLPKADVDAALVRMGRGDYDGPGEPNVVPQSNQKTLTKADRDAAVVVGGQQKHALHFADPSDRPLPEPVGAKAASPSPALTGNVAIDTQTLSGWRPGDKLIHDRLGEVTYIGPDERDPSGTAGGGSAQWVQFADGTDGMVSADRLSGYVAAPKPPPPPRKTIPSAAGLLPTVKTGDTAVWASSDGEEIRGKVTRRGTKIWVDWEGGRREQIDPTDTSVRYESITADPAAKAKGAPRAAKAASFEPSTILASLTGSDSDNRKSLSRYTIKDLKAIAEAQGRPIPSSVRQKPDMVAHILAALGG